MSPSPARPAAITLVSPAARWPEGEARYVLDASGSTWRVSERQPPSHLADRCERCLIFDAGTVVRRVCGQGPDWRLLSDAELLALCALPA
ncbi:hypothetical protein [Roseisolibacter agri]|uniref:Uncharacterized protein n=1 Tax=Roseisolibacter agri TaxID=2014610 RepID=A0AA37QDI0_9BACT|nr:hypothetical protein [Roseisolibacter agri]GLC23753.1 hypothetical protein rosag_02660 [Roseisolibacter agri]